MGFSKTESGKGMKRSEAYNLIEDFVGVLIEHYESLDCCECPEKLDWFKMTCLDLGPFAASVGELFNFIIDNNDVALFEKLNECLEEIDILSKIADDRRDLYDNIDDILHDEFLTDLSQYLDRLYGFFTPMFNVGKLLNNAQTPPERKEEILMTLPKDRIVQDEKLDMIKGYFNFNVWGKPISEEDGNKTYFDLLIEELKRPRKKKDLAKALLIVYESKAMNRHKKPSFSMWLSVWADYFGMEKITYKPNQLNTNGLESVFYYLNK